MAKSRAEPVSPAAIRKAQRAVNTLSKKYKKDKQKYITSRNKVEKYRKSKKKADKKLFNKWSKTSKADKKRRDRTKKSLDKANSKLKSLKKENAKVNKAAIADAITEQRHSHKNEGKAAIYPTDGQSSTVIFISPSDSESESSNVNITSWPVDVGSPRSDHARTSSETKSIGGLITGDDRAEANSKYQQLVKWRDNHTELTYDGSFFSDHLLISELGQTFTNMRDNLKVTIGFQYVRYADITKEAKSTGKHSKNKKSKSSKTTAGSRNKRYTAITIKPGDTLLGLSRKYGQSVAWLQKVNKIKNPNKIIAGNSLYVSPKQKKLSRKARVK